MIVNLGLIKNKIKNTTNDIFNIKIAALFNLYKASAVRRIFHSLTSLETAKRLLTLSIETE
jgi:hypothetical protein